MTLSTSVRSSTTTRWYRKHHSAFTLRLHSFNSTPWLLKP